MQYLKRNNFLLFISLLFLMGCSTSYFRVKREVGERTELLITPDRIVLQCEELDEDPDVGAYGFMIHMLDEENRVHTAALSVRPDKKNCEYRIKAISKILKNGREIYFGGFGNLKDHLEEKSNFQHTFPNHGTFYVTGAAFTFVVIANEHGECHSASYIDEKPCARDEFPIGPEEK